MSATLPLALSRIGRTVSSTVPGWIVERSTTAWNPDFEASALPMDSITRLIAETSWLPFGLEGVPTQTNERSVSRTAWATSFVTRTRPEATTSRVSSCTPSSTMGERPLRMRSSL